MVRARRRAVLAAMGSVAIAGCLDSGGGDDGQSPSPTDTESPQQPADESQSSDEGASADDTSTPEDTPTPEDEPTPTPENEPTPTPEDEPTPTPEPTPPEGRRDAEIFPDYEMTNVAVRSSESALLGWVRAAIADTRSTRYTGLSETEDLPPDYGMIFVFDDVAERRFVMREMDFGLDIVYADDEGRISKIHHAPEPGPDEDGSRQFYPGTGQYVLEVNKGWTTEHGVEEGDMLSDLPDPE